MAFLINRNPAARFECLHSLVKLISARFGKVLSFSLNDVKYNPDEMNVHEYCSLLTESDFGFDYCPYLQNPLSEAGCNMTNGINCDSTKSKEVGNTVNALHALGFVYRDARDIILTDSGVAFAQTNYGTDEMQNIISSAVLRYGPVVGVLDQISKQVDLGGYFETSDIYVGYPNSNERVSYHGTSVLISAGSQDDSNTRTKSCILAWLTAGGYIRPTALEPTRHGEYPHYKYKDFINQSHRGDKKYVFIKKAPFMNGHSFTTEAPLDYKNLTKLTAALRENGQESIREATLLYEPKIQNRRLAIIFLLDKAYRERKELSFTHLLDILQRQPNLFVVNPNSLEEVIHEEINITNMAGIPFVITGHANNIKLKPITGVNIQELTHGAPLVVTEYLSQISL